MNYPVACLVALIALDAELTYAMLTEHGATELNHLLRHIIERFGAEVLLVTHGALCLAALSIDWDPLALGLVIGFYLHASIRNIREFLS